MLNVLELPDDIWLNILSCLQSKDLLSVSRSCKRLEQITADKSLWKDVDFGPYCLTLRRLKKAVLLFHRGTRSLRLRGFRKTKAKGSHIRKHVSLSSILLRSINRKSPFLHTLELDYHFIDAEKLPITAFPPSLQVLKICNTVIMNPPERRSYFHDISQIVPNITSLSLNGSYTDDSALMPISKLEHLKNLSLRNCHEMGTCIAYLAISAFGFKALEVLDIRKTRFHDSTVHALKRIKTLKELYLDGEHLPEVSTIDCLSDRLLMVFEGEPSGLQVLHLKNSDITDISLSLIPRVLPHLRELNLQGSKHTANGVLELKCRMPQLTIVSK